MKKMKKKLVSVLKAGLPIFLGAVLPFFAQAEESRPVIQYNPISMQGINKEEARFIESLLLSYLSDAGQITTLISPPEKADFILSGSIYRERESRVFTIIILDTRTGETVQSTSVHKNSSDLVLKARSLVENAFRNHVNPYLPNGETPELITENNIIGTWRGEAGIEAIRFQGKGRGIAFFSSGVQMELAYAIEDNTLKIWQNCPNLARFYHHMPPEIAKQISAQADPIRWEMTLISGGTRLNGMKISWEAKYEDDNLINLLPETRSKTYWTRSGR